MSIVKAINELSGKEATTIEKAIRNLEPGGGGGVEIVNITATGTLPNISGTSDKTHAELLSAYNSGKVIIANVEIPQGGGPALDATPLAFTDYMDGVFSGNVVLHNGSNAWMVGIEYSSYSLYLHATKISVAQS